MTSNPASTPASNSPTIERQLATIRRWLAWLTVAVFFGAVALLLFVSAVLGALIDFHYGESILIAGTASGGVAMGFLFGWLARRALPNGTAPD